MNSKGINKVYTLCLLFVCISFQYVYSQSFGLGFYGYDVHQEKRTGLDLSPDKPLYIKGSFGLSFDMALRPYQKTYYGYVVRIINGDHTNIDLIYDPNPLINRHFKLIIGDYYSRISFDIPQSRLISQYNTIRIQFNAEKQTLTVYSGKESFSQRVNFNVKGDYKILFGVNKYHSFQTTDVPPMLIRNIRLTEGDRLTHRWPLDEYSGNTATDIISSNYAYVVNPLWLKKKHYDWELARSLTLTGEHTVAFDEQSESIYITGSDTLFKYIVPRDTLAAIACNTRQFVIQGGQSIYVPGYKLLDVSIDRRQVAAFDFGKNSWDKMLNDSLPYSGFYHHNKFFSPADTSLYVIGGYGHHKFENEVRRYRLASGKWEMVKTSGNFLPPHYLSALGVVNTGAYILGGYGSISGDQSINPRYFYSLTYFDVKTRQFKKIYDLKMPAHDFVFANSMVINKAANSYYALLFDKDNFNSKLQLICGSLTKPEFYMAGNTIPYVFQDISSFADLFYCKKSGRLIAVTLNRNEKNQTRVNIYSIYTPPFASVSKPAATSSFNYWQVICLALLAAVIFVIYRKRTALLRVVPHRPVKPKPALQPGYSKIQHGVFMFGDLQVVNAAGNDLTMYFTPLIKELFLALLIYSIRWERGISSKKLEELLWSGKSSSNAHNSRAVNMGRLRNILDKMDGFCIAKEGGYWKISIEDERNPVDYKQYLHIIAGKQQMDKQKIIMLAAISGRGCFLSDVEFEWLDIFKSEISNEIINIYLNFAANEKIADDPEFFVQLANYIFHIDPANEDAMMMKCRSLSYLGKHSLAKTTFENFSKEYEMIYGEKFPKDFPALIDSLHKLQL